MTHAMGRVPYGPQPDIFDLFRFTAPGTRLFSNNTPAPAAYFSVDGGTTTLAAYGENSDPSDFLNAYPVGSDPSSPLTSEDAFNQYYDANTKQYLTPVDLTQMDVLGFNPGELRRRHPRSSVMVRR